MDVYEAEFAHVVHREITSNDPDVKLLGIKHLYVLMTGLPALDDATALSTVKSMCAEITAALA